MSTWRLPLLSLLVFTGCQLRGFDLNERGDGPKVISRRDGGEVAVEVGSPDFPPNTQRPDGDVRDGCSPRAELCNGLDDNCNGLVDETFDFNTDSKNCGICGKSCAFPNARAACSVGVCRLEACMPGFVNLDKLEPDGCECQVSNDGVEICDGKDNDCNGVVDDGFDVQSSVQNCGTCGRVCEFPHAAALCTAGACQMGACDPGFLDIDKNPRTGCEYPCVPSNNGVEICDGQDNNCDGNVDESDARVGQRCWPDGLVGCDVASGTCRGGCAFGTYACLPGGLVCSKPVLPLADLCDGVDNNCDGVVDEDYDLQNDPRWCGSCGNACDVPNAIPACTQGKCGIKFCRTGFVDLDQQLANGCEYACTPDGPEVCDGKDNDCDGLTDTADSDLLYPMVNFCSQVGECGKGPGGSTHFQGASFPECAQPAGAARPDWICNYPATVQLFAPNQIQGDETWCDGLDNDCDGMADEYAKLGDDCTDNGIGECKKKGVLRCQSDKTLAAYCDVSAAATPLPTDEVCDGKDNDCDGTVDESWDNPAGGSWPTCAGVPCRGVRDDVVHVTTAGSDFYIYKYEASRVDATVMAQGNQEARSCSRLPTAAGLAPWTLVSLGQAKTACAAAGMRLCKVARTADCSSGAVISDEWGAACAGGAICPGAYPYACTYDSAACNGADRGATAPVNSGSSNMCITGDLDTGTGGVQAAYDMSGNVAEWTDDCRGVVNDGSGRNAYTLRGGSFTSVAQALRCDFMSLVVAESFSFDDTGFRCCSSCAPGTADCGACVDLASDSSNCGACGKACAGGQSCQNGSCR